MPTKSTEIVFGFDMAGIGTENTKYVLDLITMLSMAVTGSPHLMSLSAIYGGCVTTFGEDNHLLFSDANSVQDIASHLDGYTTLAFNAIMRKVRLQFQSRNMTKVAVVFIDKAMEPLEFRNSVMQSKYMAYKKVDLFVIGVGDRLNGAQARALTNRNGRLFWVDKYEYLVDIAANVICAMSLI